jgi:hypothetical protein
VNKLYWLTADHIADIECLLENASVLCRDDVVIAHIESVREILDEAKLGMEFHEKNESS